MNFEMEDILARVCLYDRAEKGARMTEKDLIIQDLRRENAELRARVQEWISVTERLPEPFVSVLVHMPGEEPCPTVREGFISNDGIWQSAMFRREPGEVTHWQPMPQPPKGE